MLPELRSEPSFTPRASTECARGRNTGMPANDERGAFPARSGPPAGGSTDDATILGAPDATEFTRTRADVERFQRGELVAFDDIWRRYRPALEMLIAVRVQPSLAPELRARIEADDILQLTARTVREKLGEFRYLGPGSVMAWMSTILQHVVSDMIRYWRAEQRDPRRERPLSHGDDTQGKRSGFSVVDPGSGPATAAGQAELRQRVAGVLSQLSERHQTIVLWRFFGGASWEEIAEAVGSPSDAAVRMEFRGKILPLLGALLPKPG